jgi:1-acyl-sn-glycerol-3-phosphate acyltransferase
MPDRSSASRVPPSSRLALWLFGFVVRSYFRRHFRAVMLQHGERLANATGPIIVYANHSSWWDPMVSTLLAQRLLPGRTHFAPMDAAALQQYPVLRKIGIFPVEMNSARGAAQFLRTSQAILQPTDGSSGGVIWITPQGRFADPRTPLAFKPGLGALATRIPGLTILPLAIEYTFWDERLPETLLRFGEPLHLREGVSSEDATATLAAALEQTMRALAADVQARDARAFRTLLRGGRGTGGLYALGRNLRAWMTRTPIQLDHTQREETLADTDAR